MNVDPAAGDLVAAFAEFDSPTVSDALDRLGIPGQPVCPGAGHGGTGVGGAVEAAAAGAGALREQTTGVARAQGDTGHGWEGGAAEEPRRLGPTFPEIGGGLAL